MAVAVASPGDHAAKADWLLKTMRANDGLAPVDLERFWADQRVALANPFGKDIPQIPLAISMGACAFDEMGVPEDCWRYARDEAWRLQLNKAYNDRAEKIVGRRLLSEARADATRRWPGVRGLHDVFEAGNEWHGQSWWLMQSATNEEELKALLDRVEARLEPAALRRFLLPPNWEEEKARLTALGVRPPLYRGQRGPVTFATSIYGVENLVFLIQDHPDLATRFRDAMLAAMLGIARVLDEEAGFTPETSPRGFSFLDDNCCLLTPGMYELFGYPILKGIWDVYSPKPGDGRYQHSDSAMAHLLPLLGRLNLTGTNFGPTVSITEIREHLPHAVIDGQLGPFTFSRNEEEKIVLEFLRDFEQSREHRGVRFTTAGGTTNGSRLTGMRLIMSAVQHFGRYEAE